MTMWGFVGVVIIFGVSGFTMIHYEKKYDMIDDGTSDDEEKEEA